MNSATQHIVARWEHFPHQADMGIRGVGVTLAEAYAMAARALTAIVTDPDTVLPRYEIPIEVHEVDDELLFVDFLNALIYEMATRNMLFTRVDVAINQHRVRAIAHGENVDVARHQPAVEVKGATYTELHVGQCEDGHWIAQCVVDV